MNRTLGLALLLLVTGCNQMIAQNGMDSSLDGGSGDMRGPSNDGATDDMTPEACTVRGTACGPGMVCTGDTLRCAPCGELGQSCCEGGSCSNSVCTLGDYTETCQSNCGHIGQPCCAVGKIECSTGTCFDVSGWGPTCLASQPDMR
jgi:hypothetical protein